MRKMLTWEELDRCATADEVAALLRRHNIRGVRCLPGSCPLAVATGWHVGNHWAGFRGSYRCLTPAERMFVARIDAGEYSDLVEERASTWEEDNDGA